MKLYELPRNTFIKYKNEHGEIFKIFFDHIDGAYSYCTYKGDVVHLHACTDVEIWDESVDTEHLESQIRI